MYIQARKVVKSKLRYISTLNSHACRTFGACNFYLRIGIHGAGFSIENGSGWNPGKQFRQFTSKSDEKHNLLRRAQPPPYGAKHLSGDKDNKIRC